MRKLAVPLAVLTAALLGWCPIANGQPSTEKIERGIQLIKDFCGTGSSKRSEQEAVGKIEGGVSLRRLPGIEAQGTIRYTQQEAQGLAAALQRELTDQGVQLSRTQIDCMRPFISRILDAILGPDQHSVAPDPRRRVIVAGIMDEMNHWGQPADRLTDQTYLEISDSDLYVRQSVRDGAHAYRINILKLQPRVELLYGHRYVNADGVEVWSSTNYFDAIPKIFLDQIAKQKIVYKTYDAKSSIRLICLSERCVHKDGLAEAESDLLFRIPSPDVDHLNKLGSLFVELIKIQQIR